ncbi:MAG: hypothetical protein U0795_04330 [Pirellulales bacterium]
MKFWLVILVICLQVWVVECQGDEPVQSVQRSLLLPGQVQSDTPDSGDRQTLSLVRKTSATAVSQVDLAVKAWRDRQAKIKSALFVMDCRRVLRAQTMTPPEQPEPRLPLHDVVAKNKLTASLQENAWRVTLKGQIYHLQHQHLVDTQYLLDFDGKNYRALMAPLDEGQPAKGVIGGDGVLDPLATTLFFTPIFYWHQSGNRAPEAIRLDPERWQFAGEEKTRRIHGKECLMVTENRSDGAQFTLALDSQAEYSLVELQCTINGQKAFLIDIENTYDRDAKVYVPSGWQATLIQRGVLTEFYDVDVQEYRLNVPVDLEYSFPEGTIVEDYRTDTTSTAGKSQTDDRADSK